MAIALDVARRSKRAFGGPVHPPHIHIGPIKSAVPGRTDNHPLHVPSGSYVLPADHVSSLGQGNTEAGMKVVHRMFGAGGRFGAVSGALPGMSPGLPHLPAMSDRGGARGEGPGAVPIMAAGGEYVISPQAVARVGGGDLKRGHAILDKWVIENRKHHVKTLQKLPGPAKS